VRVCSVADGRLLGDRLLSYGGNSVVTGGDVPVVGHTEHGGYGGLLHERHHHGLHRRPNSRHRYRALQSASANRSDRDEDARVQPREVARRSLHRDHFHIHVDRERGSNRYDGAHRLRCSPRAGEGRCI